MKHLRKFNEGTYQAHSTIPDANSKAYDKLQAGVKKYGMDSKFMKEYKALCQQARYEELDSFFARWGIQATNESIDNYRFKDTIQLLKDVEAYQAYLEHIFPNTDIPEFSWVINERIPEIIGEPENDDDDRFNKKLKKIEYKKH